MKIKISRLDKKFSQYVRGKAGWKCERCGKQYRPPTSGLHCAHIFTRAKKSTRFDIDNLKSWCYGCHSYMDGNPLDKYDWYIKKHGQKKFDQLRLKSNIPQKPDYTMLELWVNIKLKELNIIGEELFK